jgi:protein-S-isoprenylcysteine O-methyltransferase Ste14
MALSAAVAQRVLTRDAPALTTHRATAAAAVAVASGSLAVAAARRFRRTGTTVEPFRLDQTSALVTSGANALSRNPMYLGLAGLLVANAIRRGSWLALLPVAGYVTAVSRLQVAAEESALLAKFGEEYRAYRAAVPRWVDHRSLQRLSAVRRPGAPDRRH